MTIIPACVFIFFNAVSPVLSSSPATPTPPDSVRIDYSEKAFEITWDSVQNATGYNLYTTNDRSIPFSKRKRVNNKVITSGTRYNYIWRVSGDKRIRDIKGRRHFVTVTSVLDTGDMIIESPHSKPVDNLYFEGFGNAVTSGKIKKILTVNHSSDSFSFASEVNTAENFIEFMIKDGKYFSELLSKKIDPLKIGGCVPIATALLKILKKNGITAYRADGKFIEEFHSFNIINIDEVVYILDFATDQFVPGFAPVMFPAEFSHINNKGRLSKKGKPVYTVNKVYSEEEINIDREKKESIPYIEILNEILK
ncbi:MAG: hypothetical protein ACLFQK_06070 [Fibrobacterota bacterium]